MPVIELFVCDNCESQEKIENLKKRKKQEHFIAELTIKNVSGIACDGRKHVAFCSKKCFEQYVGDYDFSDKLNNIEDSLLQAAQRLAGVADVKRQG